MPSPQSCGNGENFSALLASWLPFLIWNWYHAIPLAWVCSQTSCGVTIKWQMCVSALWMTNFYILFQASNNSTQPSIQLPHLPPTSSQHVYMETPKPGKIRLLLIYRGRIGDTALLGKRTSKCSKNNWDLMCKRWNGWKEFCWGWSWSEFPHFLTGSNSECAVQSSLDRKLASMKSSDMSWAGVWKLKLLHNIGAPFTCSVLLFSYSNIFPPWYWVL